MEEEARQPDLGLGGRDLLDPKLAVKIEKAKNWPTFKYGALTPQQHDIVSWLAFGALRPYKIHGLTIKALLRRGIIEKTAEPPGIRLTSKGREYIKTMR